MPTYAQLQAEVWWGQEIVTDELDWLADALCSFFGVPRSNGGTKGNNVHLNGGHRSQRWILNSRYCTNRTYTVEPGLPSMFVNDIAAFDVTLPPQHMLTISRNADRATRAGKLEELVEWFGNVDGDQRVDGWNNIENRVASSDSSHLWHLHGRVKRSLLRDMNAMRRIFAALTGTQGALMPNYTADNPNTGVNVEAQISALMKLEPVKVGALPPGNVKGMVGEAYPMPNALATKLQEILVAAQAGGGAVTPSPEQWAALTASITQTIETLFAEKVGAAAELAAEAAVRRVLGSLDGAVPPPTP